MGPKRDGFGSLLELTTGSSDPGRLANGAKRSFLEDGDEIVLRVSADAKGFVPIGFGKCRAIIPPTS